MHEMSKVGVPRLHLAGPETMHMAHVLKQLDRGFFSGMSTQNRGRSDRRWKQHFWSSEDPEISETVQNSVARLEFQEQAYEEHAEVPRSRDDPQPLAGLFAECESSGPGEEVVCVAAAGYKTLPPRLGDGFPA